MYVPSNEARLNIGNTTMIALTRADYWILNNMSDKELHDIGIARGDIRNVVSESFK
jgi:hypothetical protein